MNGQTLNKGLCYELVQIMTILILHTRIHPIIIIMLIDVPGIDTNNEEHQKYLETFCVDFENMLLRMIGKSITEHKNSDIDSPLYSEVCQHALFCQAKIEMFHGRKNTLHRVYEYIKNSSRSPLVLYGKSGCGKTSIMAMMAKMVQELTKENVCVILRYENTRN